MSLSSVARALDDPRELICEPTQVIEHLDWYVSNIYLLNLLFNLDSCNFRGNVQFWGSMMSTFYSIYAAVLTFVYIFISNLLTLSTSRQMIWAQRTWWLLISRGGRPQISPKLDLSFVRIQFRSEWLVSTRYLVGWWTCWKTMRFCSDEVSLAS